jgi:hypothetical protein
MLCFKDTHLFSARIYIFTPVMERAVSSETFVDFYKTAWLQSSEYVSYYVLLAGNVLVPRSGKTGVAEVTRLVSDMFK